MTYYIITRKLEGEDLTSTGAVEATASGAVLGPLRKYLTPGGVPVIPGVQNANEGPWAVP